MSADTSPIRAVVAYGLPGSEAWLPEDILGELAWQELFADVVRERATGLLTAAIAGDALPVTTRQAEQADEAQLRAMSVAVALERELLAVVELLSGGGIEHRVVKGPASAHLDYPDPAMRTFADIDVLVRSEQWDDAVDLLSKSGLARAYLEPRPGFDRRFSKGNTFTMRSGYELDLHRTLIQGPFGQSLVLDDLWAEPATFALAGEWLNALPDDERFLNACFHAALGDIPPRLVLLRDVAQLALVTGVDTDRVIALAVTWQAEAVVARAVNLAWDHLALADKTALSAWALRLRPERRQAAAIQLYLDRREISTALNIAALGWIRGVRDKAFYLRALAFPDREFVVQRYSGRVARWRHATQVLQRRIVP